MFSMPFTKKLSVGNRLLDTEQQRLLAVTREITRSVNECDSGVQQECFRQLEDKLHHYFAVKENIAHAIGFDFTRQRQANRSLLDRARQIMEKLSSENSSLSEREKVLLAGSLSDHLIQHFVVDCRPLKLVLDTHYYDFCPDNPVFA